MNEAAQMAPVKSRVFDWQLAEAIARDTGAPIELVARIYQEELVELSRKARIDQFINVLANRRARLRLRRQRLQ